MSTRILELIESEWTSLQYTAILNLWMYTVVYNFVNSISKPHTYACTYVSNDFSHLSFVYLYTWSSFEMFWYFLHRAVCCHRWNIGPTVKNITLHDLNSKATFNYRSYYRTATKRCRKYSATITHPLKPCFSVFPSRALYPLLRLISGNLTTHSPTQCLAVTGSGSIGGPLCLLTY